MTRNLLGALALAVVAIIPAHAQDRGAARLHALVNGLTVTPRVLLIGARPTDADEDLIAWLARGHHVQTGYLSLTRGESAPNYTGLETGATLGAIHVQELLAARRIDGGEQFFTRAYDFGSVRNAADAFEQWDHETLLGDVVAVVRAFRPQVIMAMSRPDTTDLDGQHAVSAIMAREVFDAALDTTRFSVKKFGIPWTPSALYEPGEGVRMDAREFDRIRGESYATIGAESRAQLRSFGFMQPPWREQRNPTWRRIATRVDEAASRGTSIFDGIDTTFARLIKAGPMETLRPKDAPPVTQQQLYQLPLVMAYADSAREALDFRNPSAVLPYLKSLMDQVSGARALLRGCRHPARDAAMSLSYQPCKPEWLDLDASLDLVMRRSSEALLNAAGVTIDITADREFLASFNQALVTVAVTNNGDSVVTVNDVTITGGIPVRITEPLRVAPHSSREVTRSVVSVAYAHPYWIWKREKNFYPSVLTSLDGVARPAQFNERFSIASVAVPEGIRRLTEVTATLGIGRTTTVTSSIGQVLYRSAEPMFGVRERGLSGVPPVTFTFERALEWAQANKPVKKNVRVIMRSFSDSVQTFAMKTGTLVGNMKFDALPPKITLAPHEAKEVSLPVSGEAPENRYDLPLLAISGKDTMNVGFRTAQYSYLPPVHLFRDAMLSVEAVNIRIPERLAIVYVRGAGDDADVGLKQLGVPSYVVNNEGLTRFELENISTVVLGPDALRIDPNLVTQMPRLTEFMRKGGTVVMLSNPSVLAQPGVLPFPVRVAQPLAEAVTREDATVTVTDAKARVLTWPNAIGVGDWDGWTDARATNIPTTADPRYSTMLEMHDPRQPENRNSVLVANVGKGKFVYTSLTLTQQISNAVPGAMRLLVNLLSAGLTADSR